MLKKVTDKATRKVVGGVGAKRAIPVGVDPAAATVAVKTTKLA